MCQPNWVIRVFLSLQLVLLHSECFWIMNQIQLRFSPAACAWSSSASMSFLSVSRSHTALLEGGALQIRMVWRVCMQGGREWMMHIAMAWSLMWAEISTISLLTWWVRFISVQEIHDWVIVTELCIIVGFHGIEFCWGPWLFILIFQSFEQSCGWTLEVVKNSVLDLVTQGKPDPAACGMISIWPVGKIGGILLWGRGLASLNILVRACLRPGTCYILVLAELWCICRTDTQGDKSLLDAWAELL